LNVTKFNVVAMARNADMLLLLLLLRVEVPDWITMLCISSSDKLWGLPSVYCTLRRQNRHGRLHSSMH
jgi:hypothetical protein